MCLYSQNSVVGKRQLQHAQLGHRQVLPKLFPGNPQIVTEW
jgi:hypothetical protein